MNPVLFWNGVMLEASRRDHTLGFGRTLPGIPGEIAPQHGGPTRTSRAMAIVSIAIHDAVCAVRSPGAAYLTKRYGQTVAAPEGALVEQVIAGAASASLSRLYPRMCDYVEQALAEALFSATDRLTEAFAAGLAIGAAAFEQRRNDPVEGDGDYEPSVEPGRHRADPFNPGQGHLTAQWGALERFSGAPQVELVKPPELDSHAYAIDSLEVLEDGVRSSKTRSAEQTAIGLYWGYDGAYELGVPPRLYNQVARQLILQQDLSLEAAAEALAVLNVGMADAGIDAWRWKYVYKLWRPVAAFNDPTQPPKWAPLGLPRTNDPSPRALEPMTPNFPAYPSGHATFGAAAFQALRLCLFPDRAPIGLADVLADRFEQLPGERFEATSEELNGLSLEPGPAGRPRPRAPRTFASFAHAIYENAVSRVYLGVHWRFDGLPRSTSAPHYGGVPLGLEIGRQAHALFAAAPSLATPARALTDAGV